VLTFGSCVLGAWYRVLVILCIPGASLYYEASGGRACARCHEIWQLYADWHTSAHRNIKCTECHGHVFTLDAGFHLNNMRRVFTHLQGDARNGFASGSGTFPRSWPIARDAPAGIRRLAGRTARRFRIGTSFLTRHSTRKNILMDDCLRCHGMHFEGSIRELVQPITTTAHGR